MDSVHPSFLTVLHWCRQEKAAWAGEKYSAIDEDRRTLALQELAKVKGAGRALLEDSGWYLRGENYLSRALTLGLETPLGRQAILKFATHSIALAASAIRLYGEPPKPGSPSGEL